MRSKLILASSSPRRLELLGQIGVVPDQTIPADIDESIRKGESPRALAGRLADAKAAKIAKENPGHFVLAADTVVACGRRVIDKTEDENEARAAIMFLSGRRHKVYTGHRIIAPDGFTKGCVCETIVQFRRLHKDEIERYVHGRDWAGKAGAYGIQGPAAAFVKFLSGSYSNVLGLSLYDTDRLLKSAGYGKE